MQKILRFALLSLGLCSVLLSGCAFGWSRPNASEAESNQDRYECQQQAARMYPVVMVQRTVGVGYQAPAQTNCYTYGSNTSCTTIGGIYVPPATETKDANLNSRNTAFSSCMKAKGYTFKMEFKK